MYEHETDTNNSKQYICPHCGSKNLSYGNGNLTDDYYIYDFSCRDCGAEGIEYNLLTFCGYEYNTPKDLEEIEKQEEIEHAKRIIRKAEEQIKAANEILAKYENKE